ncbi:hypothetical protein BKA93DRAFT_750099 [Sparassis latifolia]
MKSSLLMAKSLEMDERGLDWYQHSKRERFSLEHLKEAPSRGSRDALGTVSIDLPLYKAPYKGVNPRQIMPYSSASQGHLPKNSVRSSTAKDSSENKAANDLLTAGHPETADEDSPFAALELPIFMIMLRSSSDIPKLLKYRQRLEVGIWHYASGLARPAILHSRKLVDRFNAPNVREHIIARLVQRNSDADRILLGKKAVNNTNLPTVRVAFG